MKKLISFALRHIPRKYLQLFSHFGLRVVAVFYRGNNVECTVCHSTFKKFLPYGRVDTRENALCPHCLSLERHRLLWTFLQEKTDFFTARLKVLHVAPELCFINRFESLENLDYITADLESPLAKVHMDVHEIPFNDNTFDVVFCNHVLEHVESDQKVLSEFYRVMKPGAWAIMQSPIYYHLEETYEDPLITDPAEREKHFGQDDHVRIFGTDYGERLRAAGFDVTEDNMVKEISEEKAFYHGYDMRETIYFIKKPG